MSKLKYAITFGIGFVTSVVVSFFVSNLLLKDVTDSNLHIILNGFVFIILTALINIPVYLFIINNKDK